VSELKRSRVKARDLLIGEKRIESKDLYGQPLAAKTAILILNKWWWGDLVTSVTPLRLMQGGLFNPPFLMLMIWRDELKLSLGLFVFE
jgi:hypothetical protein